MASQRLTIRLSAALAARLEERSRARGQVPSKLVRAAIESYLNKKDGQKSAYEQFEAARLIGCVHGLPKDLSSNPRYFEDFGRNK